MVAAISAVDRRSGELESAVPVGTAGEVRDRLQAFLARVTAGVFSRSEQRATGALYARGLLDPAGLRKSAEPLWGRSDRSVTYESLQHFLADSTWDPDRLIRNVVEAVHERRGGCVREDERLLGHGCEEHEAAAQAGSPPGPDRGARS
ncbi:MAG: transposase [Solirubrobacteraceae bacterium]